MVENIIQLIKSNEDLPEPQSVIFDKKIAKKTIIGKICQQTQVQTTYLNSIFATITASSIFLARK